MNEDEADRHAAQALGCAAQLQIAFANKMSEEGKLAVAEWLRTQAEKLLYDGQNYSYLYTATFEDE